MKVWKIASRWSKTGTKESSVLDVFRKYKIVFAGTEIEKIKEKVKDGNLIAISDGLRIVSVAKVISAPTSITSFDIECSDKLRFEYENWVVAFKVEIFNLNEDEIFTTRMGTFHGMGQYSAKVEKIYNSKLSSNTTFEINTYTYTLLNPNPKVKTLIQKNLKYVISVYQRPYSWNESQIEIFLNDIFISYWGTEKNVLKESIFIGTMQLSEKKYFNNKSNYQEIIDGQQRITTLTLLLKFLSRKYTKNKTLETFDFNWLDTDVNRGQQSKDLKEVIDENIFDNELNKYASNYKLLEKYFELNIKNDDESIEFKEDDFISHLLTNLYFVVIETKAGLSKTLQIFNAINTTGLDLNSTDVFKIRLYEYLSNNGDSKEVFEKIDELYEKIDIGNKEANRKITDMNGILGIYKSFLITKYGLNMSLWRMATGTFFERLFDTLLNIKEWSDFRELNKVKDFLKIEDLFKIIAIRYIWDNKHYGQNGDFDDFNTMLSIRLLWNSRYSNYWNLAFLYLMKDDAVDEKYNELIQELSKLYISYTFLYQKQVNEIHKFTKNIFEELLKDEKDINTIIESVKVKYKSKENEVKRVISADIFWNPKIKNILAKMSASIDENDNGKSIKEVERLIFETKIDIEHIQSANDEDINKRDDVKKEWHGVLNSIGNLMILEYSINRSIGNNPFSKKIKQYEKSKFYIVRNLSKKFPTWTIVEGLKRKEMELKKIYNFIYA